MASNIKVALDSSMVINLFTLIHPKNDIDGKVMKALKNKTLNTEDWRTVPLEDRPNLLRDKFLGYREGGVYPNLMDVYNILKWIINGKIEACITPTTLIELEDLNDIESEFLEKHITILPVNAEQEEYIYGQIDKLAKEYVAAGAVKDEYVPEFRKRTPTRDAYIMAEASFCGLSLITSDGKDLIHSSSVAKDYARTEIIKKVNREYKDVNLCFTSITGKKLTTCAVLFNTFVKNIKQEKFYLYTDESSLNLNENNEITLR